MGWCDGCDEFWGDVVGFRFSAPSVFVVFVGPVFELCLDLWCASFLSLPEIISSSSDLFFLLLPNPTSGRNRLVSFSHSSVFFLSPSPYLCSLGLLFFHPSPPSTFVIKPFIICFLVAPFFPIQNIPLVLPYPAYHSPAFDGFQFFFRPPSTPSSLGLFCIVFWFHFHQHSILAAPLPRLGADYHFRLRDTFFTSRSFSSLPFCLSPSIVYIRSQHYTTDFLPYTHTCTLFLSLLTSIPLFVFFLFP